MGKRNLVFCTDSYKPSHYLQFPEGTEKAYYYIESRGGTDRVLFFGLQAILKKILVDLPTKAQVLQAEAFWNAHGEPFNTQGWLDLVDLGYFPLEINAVTEGEFAPVKQPLVTIVNTDPRFFWLPGWIETRLMQLWYPVTVATRQRQSRDIILQFLKDTGDPAGIDFKLHSFGYRGVSSEESAGIGGMAELLSSKGTDTVAGILDAQEYYNTNAMLGFSIPAAEHSTITSWGKDKEVDAYRNMLKQFGGKYPIIAVVSDSYDLENAVINIWGNELKQEVLNSGSMLVVRPDSGDPATVVLRTAKQLEAGFGVTVNEKGYKVLNNVRIIQGDGIGGPEDIDKILSKLCFVGGYSADNLAFGQGGGSLQQVNRDTFKFAMKCSAVKQNGQWHDAFKNPVDAPWKASKAGRFNGLPMVWKDGKFVKEYTFEEVRANANK